MKTEIQNRADFSKIRYANCWEDADILIDALEPQDKHLVSIGSAGDNSLSLLAAGAKKVTIVEMNPAQVECIKLRLAAYQSLEHSEYLQLHGETASENRWDLFQRCKPHLSTDSQSYWEDHPHYIDRGIGQLGKFENYFSLFRNRALPLVHSQGKIRDLIQPRNSDERAVFFESKWNTLRWRGLFHFFFSRFVMGRLGRDPEFFKYVEGRVSDRILERTRYALVDLEPDKNPYLTWILTGKFGTILPHALREENYEKIRQNIHRIEICQEPLESLLEKSEPQTFDGYNLSDIFEYMSLDNTRQLLRNLATHSTPGARLAYWNMQVPRSRPEELASSIQPLPELSNQLFKRDKAFFYSKFVVEEITN